MMESLELGADNFEPDEEFYEITTLPSDFSKVREGLEQKGVEFVEAEVRMIPQNYVDLDADASRKMGLIIDNLEDNDDVSEVWHNWNMPDDEE